MPVGVLYILAMASVGVITRWACRAWTRSARAKWRTRAGSSVCGTTSVERSCTVSTTGPRKGGAAWLVSWYRVSPWRRSAASAAARAAWAISYAAGRRLTAARAARKARATIPDGLPTAAPGANSARKRTPGSWIFSRPASSPAMYRPTPVRGAARGEALIPTESKQREDVAQRRAAEPLVHAVVVTHRGAEWLPGCLRALAAQQARARLEVVVVDNASTDSTASLLHAHFPTVTVLRLPDNQGYARANNLALRRALGAGAQYVALVNDDVELEPGWLEALLAAASAHSRAAPGCRIDPARTRRWPKVPL